MAGRQRRAQVPVAMTNASLSTTPDGERACACQVTDPEPRPTYAGSAREQSRLIATFQRRAGRRRLEGARPRPRRDERATRRPSSGVRPAPYRSKRWAESEKDARLHVSNIRGWTTGSRGRASVGLGRVNRPPSLGKERGSPTALSRRSRDEDACGRNGGLGLSSHAGWHRCAPQE